MTNTQSDHISDDQCGSSLIFCTVYTPRHFIVNEYWDV